IAVARQMGVPSRYVSGYLWTRGTSVNDEACHAWAEAWVEHLGWVGFDPSHVICPTEAYVRIASGLDYWSAAPIRGVRRGKATERMEVRVHVEHSVQQQ
ncbi:MAG: transglutaminase family protein, partial [Vicinamibacterales bacterium]